MHDVSKYLDFVQALWYELMNPNYIDSEFLNIKLDKMIKEIEHQCHDDAFYGSLYLLFHSLKDNQEQYLNGGYRIQYKVLSFVHLARYVSPDRKEFDEWISNIIEISLELYPLPYNRRDQDRYPQKYPEIYDVNQETFIPRDFYFKQAKKYSSKDLMELKDTYYSSSMTNASNGIQTTILAYMLIYKDIPSERRNDIDLKDKLSSVIELTISNQDNIDLSIFKLCSYLVYLFMSECKLDSLIFLQECTKLEFLALPYNNIEDLKGIETLKELKAISLFKNKIQDIFLLNELKKLELLNLKHNNIKVIDKLNLTNIKSLTLEGNPMNQKDIEQLEVKNAISYTLNDENHIIISLEE